MATPGLIVWVVDDDESVRWVLEQALKQAHMFPRAFEAGREFFEALEHERPDVLITDIRMPDMSGLELMERLARYRPRHSGHRDHGALGSRQRGLGVPGRRVRVPAEAVRHRRSDRARLARGAATESR